MIEDHNCIQLDCLSVIWSLIDIYALNKRKKRINWTEKNENIPVGFGEVKQTMNMPINIATHT